MSNSTAQLRAKNPRANSSYARRPRRPQGSPCDFWDFQGGRDLERGVQILAQGFLYFRGRDVGAVTPAASLIKLKMQGCGQGCRQV